MAERRPGDALRAGDSGGVREPGSVAVSGRPGSAGSGDRSGALSRVAVAAHAKINLSLKIVGRRPDGLHEIESIAQSVSLHDSISLESRDDGISLEVDDPSIPAGPENLAWRAAAAIPAPRSGPRGVHIRIHKVIPAGAGLGGGSSDAAAVLGGLRRLWRLDLSDRDLQGLGGQIGTDVPFFLVGGTALLTGTGTTVEPLQDVGGYEILIVFPGTVLSTRRVYSGTSETLTSSLKISSIGRLKDTLKGNLVEEVETWVRAGNDLEPFARTLCAAIGVIKDSLEAAGATAAMTGSGSAVFGIFRSPLALAEAEASARKHGFSATRCVPLGREEYSGHTGFT